MAGCGTTCGITREREKVRVRARALAELALRDPVEHLWDEGELEDLGGAIGEALPCRTALVGEDRARWIYAPATVAPTSWAEVLSGASATAPELRVESGLRVGLSSLGRYATLQEFSLEGEPEAGGWWVHETRCVGVVDRRLQMFVKALQGLLRTRRIECLDAAFLQEPTSDGGSLWGAFFDADPPELVRGVWIPQDESFSAPSGLAFAPAAR